MSILFEPFKVNNMELKNRFVRSATADGCTSKTGMVTKKQIKIFEYLARGGIGLIITELTSVHPTGRHLIAQNRIDRDSYIPNFQDLTARVHKKGGKIAVQLFHAGLLASEFQHKQKKEALAPSIVEDNPISKRYYHAMKDEEIWEIINVFGDAAIRAREANFDAVQIQGAHGYLLSQFLSPLTNQRTDKWGNSLENRLRVYTEIYKDIRRKVGNDYPILLKLGVQDGISHGLRFQEGKKAARILSDIGFDALEISAGIRGRRFKGTEMKPGITSPGKEAYYRKWTREIKSITSTPIIMVGGLRTFKLMEEIVQNHEADLVSLCRPFIKEPELIKKWQNNNDYKATCISCNGCVRARIKGEALHCVKAN